ncbi:MAG: DNA repair exonuclease, partial [Planctomycetes bacterium]|nr:DNA repair exonuclease [Planctomycetota bacterium]
LMLIAGDLFDSAGPSPRDVGFVRSQLQRLTDGGVKTFIIPGNHDPYRDHSFWAKADLPCTKLFTKPAFECHEVGELGVSVCGIAPDISDISKGQIGAFDAVVPTPISVLLFHGSWLNFGRETADCHPFSTDELARLPFNYVALGHYHAARNIDGVPCTAIYPGTPEAIGFAGNDLGDRFVVVGTIDDNGNVAAVPHKINEISHAAEEIDCTTETAQSLRRKIEQMLSSSVYAQIALTGRPAAEVIAASETLAQELDGACAFIDVRTRFSSVGDVPADNTYLKRFVEKMNGRIKEAPEGEEHLLSKALELGIRAFMKDG